MSVVYAREFSVMGRRRYSACSHIRPLDPREGNTHSSLVFLLIPVLLAPHVQGTSHGFFVVVVISLLLDIIPTLVCEEARAQTAGGPNFHFPQRFPARFRKVVVRTLPIRLRFNWDNDWKKFFSLVFLL